jgi:hypothetical protein
LAVLPGRKPLAAGFFLGAALVAFGGGEDIIGPPPIGPPCATADGPTLARTRVVAVAAANRMLVRMVFAPKAGRVLFPGLLLPTLGNAEAQALIPIGTADIAAIGRNA